MIERKCWWCGSYKNLSGEHKIKRTDIEKSLKEIDGDLIHRTRKIQSSNSKFLKFEKVLCAHCNNSKSQPFDKAYDIFIDYVLSNHDKVMGNESIDFSLIFPKNTIENKLNVLRYFTKHFCTRLAKNNFAIDESIIDFMNGGTKINALLIHFEIKVDLKDILEKLKKENNSVGNFYLGSLSVYKDYFNTEVIHSYLILQWLRVEFFYNRGFNIKNGINLEKLYINSPVVKLTSYDNRKELNNPIDVENDEFQEFKHYYKCILKMYFNI